MTRWRSVFRFTAVMAGVAWASMAQEEGSTLSLRPTSLTFNETAGGGAPPSQTLSVTAERRTQFTASASVQSGGTNWLRISPSGTLQTNQTLTVFVNPTGLAAGTYGGTISLRTFRGTQTVSVRLAVAQATSGITLSPTSLVFNGTLNSTAPAPQILSVTAASPTNFTASASVPGGVPTWLSISPSGALTTNRTLTVSVSLAGLAVGSYSGSIAIVANGTTRSVPVTFVVSTGSTGGGTAFKLIGWNDLLPGPRRLAVRSLPRLDARRIPHADRQRQRAERDPAGARGYAGRVRSVPRFGSQHRHGRAARIAPDRLLLGQFPPGRGGRQTSHLPALSWDGLPRDNPVENAGRPHAGGEIVPTRHGDRML